MERAGVATAGAALLFGAAWLSWASPWGGAGGAVLASQGGGDGPGAAALDDPRGGQDTLRARVDVALAGAVDVGDVEAVAAELAALGSPALPALLDQLAAGPSGGTSEHALASIAHALGELDADAVTAALVARLAGDVGPRCVALLDGLGASGSPAALRWIGATAAAVAGDLPDAARPRLAAALDGILGAHPGAIAEVGREAAALPLDIAWTHVAAIGRTGRAEALSILATVLHERPGLATPALPHLSALATRYPTWVTPEIRRAVRYRLEDGGSAQELRELARAVGAVEDPGSLALVIDLMEHEEAGVRREAQRALERVSGCAFGAAPEPWRLWLVREEAWFDERMGPLVRALDRGNLGEVTAALAEIGQHRYRTGDLADTVSGLLHREAPLVRVRACQVLQSLGAPRALPALVGALEDEDERVREAARSALRTVAGRDLGVDPGAWRNHYRLEG